MGLVPALTPFVPGTKIMASAVDAKFDAIVTVLNGNIDNANVDEINADKVTDGVFHIDRIPAIPNDKIPLLEASKVPRLSESHLPRGTSGKFLKAKGGSNDAEYEAIVWGDVETKPATATRWPKWGEVTEKPATFAPSAHGHPFNEITGKATLSQMPGGTSGRFLKAAGAGNDPAYSAIVWGDVGNKPNLVTLDTTQTVSGDKEFTGEVDVSGGTLIIPVVS